MAVPLDIGAILREFAAMRTVLLSDHPADMLEQARTRANTQQQRAMAQYESELRRHRAEVRKAEEARDQAGGRRHGWPGFATRWRLGEPNGRHQRRPSWLLSQPLNRAGLPRA